MTTSFDVRTSGANLYVDTSTISRLAEKENDPGETNYEVLRLLVEIINQKSDLKMLAEALYDMNIFGDRIFYIYKDYCGYSRDLFLKKCSINRNTRDPEMIAWINKIAIAKGIIYKAVPEGALKEGERFPSPLRTIFTSEELVHKDDIVKELVAEKKEKDQLLDIELQSSNDGFVKIIA